MSRRAIVFDTNCWVSFYLSSDGIPAKAVRLARERYTISHSPETLAELRNVLLRNKFDKVAPIEERELFCKGVADSGEIVLPMYRFQVFDDPADDKFFDLAYSAGAECIVSGDEKHVRNLKHLYGIQIWSPTQFLERLTQQGSSPHDV